MEYRDLSLAWTKTALSYSPTSFPCSTIGALPPRVVWRGRHQRRWACGDPSLLVLLASLQQGHTLNLRASVQHTIINIQGGRRGAWLLVNTNLSLLNMQEARITWQLLMDTSHYNQHSNSHSLPLSLSLSLYFSLSHSLTLSPCHKLCLAKNIHKRLNVRHIKTF